MLKRAIFAALVLTTSCSSQVRLREFVDDLPGTVNAAAVAPDGAHVALTWCRYEPEFIDNNCNIYLRPMQGGDATLLFRLGGRLALETRWSPDGKWLASIDDSSHDFGALFVRSLSGGEARSITGICWGGYSWTSDSHALIVSTADGVIASPDECQVRAYSPDGRLLFSTATRALSPQVSPDGKTLAFVRGNRIFVQKLTPAYQLMGPELLVATEDQYFSGPVWIAGGKALLYATRGRNPLRRVSIEAGATPRIVPGVDRQTDIVSLEPAGPLGAVAWIWKHDAALWRMDLRSMPLRFEKLQSVPHTDERHRVSPDGRRVIFVSEAASLWTSDLDGSKARLLTSHDEAILNPRWSPDGRWVAFVGYPAQGNADNRSRLYVVPAEGGTPRRLLAGIEDVWFSSWSRDGKWLYVARGEFDPVAHKARQIWKVNVADEKLIQITKGGGWSAEESVGGDSLYYTNETYPRLHRVPVSGGVESTLFEGQLRGSVFAVGGQSVFLVPDGPNNGRSRILKYDIPSGEVSTLVETDFVADALQLSADERYLFATSNPPVKESHVILEGLR